MFPLCGNPPPHSLRSRGGLARGSAPGPRPHPRPLAGAAPPLGRGYRPAGERVAWWVRRTGWQAC